MSAQPYGGFGYHTGFVQALAGQLQGEAQADEIARKQQQVAFNQQMALNAHLAQQEQQRLAQEQLKQSNARADAQLALQQKEAERRAAADAARQKLAEERLAAAEAKANRPKELTPYQEIQVGEKQIKAQAHLEAGNKLLEMIDQAPTAMEDAPGWFTGDQDSGNLDHAKAPDLKSAWDAYHGTDSAGKSLVPMPANKAKARAILKANLDTGAKLDALLGRRKPAAAAIAAPDGAPVVAGAGVTIGGMGVGGLVPSHWDNRIMITPEERAKEEAEMAEVSRKVAAITPQEMARIKKELDVPFSKGANDVGPAGSVSTVETMGAKIDRGAAAAQLKALKAAGKTQEFEALRKYLISQGIK